MLIIHPNGLWQLGALWQRRYFRAGIWDPVHDVYHIRDEAMYPRIGNHLLSLKLFLICPGFTGTHSSTNQQGSYMEAVVIYVGQQVRFMRTLLKFAATLHLQARV